MGRDRLRIAHVICTASFAGAERAVTISARAMAERGHDVVVLGGDQTLTAHHLRGTNVDQGSVTGVMSAVRAIRRLGELDVIHAHMTAAEAAVLLSGVHRRAQFVVTRHFAQARGSSALGGLVRVGMGRVPHVEIAISHYVAERIGVPSTVIHFGLPDYRAVQLHSKTVVVVQRLEPEKDTITAIRAWAQCGLADAGWMLKVAGDGSQRAMLEQEVDSLGVRSSVEFLGRVADVDALRADASVQLATPSGEHFGLSVLEAMASGLPVIAADGGAHRELLDECGLYFAPGAVADCAAALRLCAQEQARLRERGADLQRRQRTHFSLDSHGDLLEGVYRGR